MTTLGTLSIHLDGGPCPVGCRFCYLGARTEPADRLRLPLVEAALARLRYDEVAIALSDPLAGGAGTDNRVAIWSDRYAKQPLVIQGPGAGPEVTAAALLDDVLSLRAAALARAG